jgi:hypothetical protein
MHNHQSMKSQKDLLSLGSKAFLAQDTLKNFIGGSWKRIHFIANDRCR